MAEVLRYQLLPNADLVCPPECIETCGIVEEAMQMAVMATSMSTGLTVAGNPNQLSAMSRDGTIVDGRELPKVEVLCKGMRPNTFFLVN